MGIFTKSIIGMEIDSKEIRAVHLEGTPEKPRLLAFGRQPLQAGIVKDGKVVKPNELGSAISTLWDRERFKSRDILLGINNQDVIVRFAMFPKVPREKLDNLIRFQSQDYIPIALDEIELDYTVTGETDAADSPQYQVLLVAGKKKMLFDFIAALQLARLNVLDIGVSMLSAERLIPKELKSLPLAVINLSNDSGSILIMHEEKPGMARTFSYPLAMVQSIQTFLDHKSGAEYRMEEEELKRVSDFIAGEIRASVLYYQNLNPHVNIQNLMLTGGIARTKGLVDALKQLFEINVSLVGSLKDFTGSFSGNSYGEFKAADYAICSSLAIRGLEV